MKSTISREELNFYLQQVDPELLFSVKEKIEFNANVKVVQEPLEETVMLPVTDPVSKGSFYSAEVMVTSAIVRVNETSGWSMVLDANKKLALHIAILDGAHAAGIETVAITELILAGKESHSLRNKKISEQVAATHVSFDLM